VTVLRACVKCGKPSMESYCDEHKPKPWATSTRKARVMLSGSAEEARRKRILKRDMGACHICDQPGADEVDHVIPLGEGGPDADWTWRASIATRAIGIRLRPRQQEHETRRDSHPKKSATGECLGSFSPATLFLQPKERESRNRQGWAPLSGGYPSYRHRLKKP
jgi:5-methylcytosine-specific restriction endonuclease McrA